MILFNRVILKGVLYSTISIFLLGGCIAEQKQPNGDFICDGISYQPSQNERKIPLTKEIIKKFQATTDSFHFAIPLNKYYKSLNAECFIGIPVLSDKSASSMQFDGFKSIQTDSVSICYKLQSLPQKTPFAFKKEYFYVTGKNCVYVLQFDNDSTKLTTSLTFLKNETE